MRLTDFTELMNTQFGAQTAASMLVDHVLPDLEGGPARRRSTTVWTRAVWRLLPRLRRSRAPNGETRRVCR